MSAGDKQNYADQFTDLFGDAVARLSNAFDAGEVTALDAIAVFVHLSNAGIEWFGDSKGCDGCDRIFSAEIYDYAGFRWFEDRDANGDVTVSVCEFCNEEAREHYYREQV